MRYRELLEQLQDLDESRLDDDATVFDGVEFHPVILFDFNKVDDMLDAGHWFLSTAPIKNFFYNSGDSNEYC